MKKNCMKKVGILGILMFLTMLAVPSLRLNAQNQSPQIPNYPRIFIEGERVQIPNDEQQPMIIDGRVMVPLRAVSEALGFTIDWNAQTQSVMLEGTGYIALVQIGSYDMSVNGDTVLLDVPAQILNSRTMLPVRAISEATGFEVRWDSANRIVDILTPIVVIDYWPEYLPEHLQGSISLRSEQYFNSIVNLSNLMQFRIAFYTIPGEFLDVVDRDEFRSWAADRRERDGVIAREMLLMHFVRDFNISREQFDSIVEPLREAQERMAARGVIDLNCE
jgi:hypothetical protein